MNVTVELSYQTNVIIPSAKVWEGGTVTMRGTNKFVTPLNTYMSYTHALRHIADIFPQLVLPEASNPKRRSYSYILKY